jgi:signal transduction histidine kinase
VDGAEFEFDLDAVVVGQVCWQHASPTYAVALPLQGQGGLHGALVLVRRGDNRSRLDLADLRLLAGVGQQMGLSIENVLLLQDAQARERLLASLLRQVVEAQEAERKRIARDLHDATAQSLTAITLGLRGVEASLAAQGSPLQEQMKVIYRFANEALVELRRLIADLRPPQLDDLGLVPALRWLVQNMQQRHAVPRFRLEVDGEMPRLTAEIETLLFRIVQESLTNVVKHARAEEAVVRVAWQGCEAGAGQLVIQVCDDGVGFDAAHTLLRTSGGWGVHGIRERVQLLGGELAIRAQPGAGTTVEVRVVVPRAVETTQAALEAVV